MDLLIALVLGAIAGIVAVVIVYRTIPNSPVAIIGAILVGVLGGIIGRWLANLVGLEAANWIGSLVIAFLATLALLLTLKKIAPDN